MIHCSSCGTGNIEGAFYCEECGSPLVAVDGRIIGSRTSTLKLDVSALQNDPAMKPGWGNAAFKASTAIYLHFQEKGERITLPVQEEIVFGRNDERTQTYPDIDLTPYGALDRGVSRSHASIRRTEDTVTLFDLESVNGTYLNGQRVLPNQPRVLQDGDEIRFGKLASRIYFK